MHLVKYETFFGFPRKAQVICSAVIGKNGYFLYGAASEGCAHDFLESQLCAVHLRHYIRRKILAHNEFHLLGRIDSRQKSGVFKDLLHMIRIGKVGFHYHKNSFLS